jgi:peptidoglycan/LPS O-acetylase OafA/YrhL
MFLMSSNEQLQANLRRPHLPALDGMRAVAALLVVFYHANFRWANGSLGVLIFFVLSGFLITWLLLKEEKQYQSFSLRRFYIRRSLRIFPAFYVYWLLVVVGIGLIIKHKGLTAQSICSFFYLTNYYQAIWGDPNTGLSHTWSLAIEEQFYLFWPFLFLILKSNRVRLRFLVAAIGAIWIYRELMVLVVHVPQGYVYEALDMRADHLLIGCLLAVALFEGRFQRLWSFLCRSPLLQLATVSLFVIERVVAGSGLPRYRDWGGFILEPVLVFLLIPQLVAFTNGPVTRLLETRPMRYLGKISYSIYLYQQVVLGPVEKRLADHPIALFFGCLLVTVACASGSYFLVERPFLKLKDRFERTKPETVEPGIQPKAA